MAAKAAEIEEFASAACHDLREPVRKIIAFSDLLLAGLGVEPVEKIQGYAGRIRSAAVRMRQLVDALLEFTRVETGTNPTETAPLSRVVQDAVEDLETMISEAGASVTAGPLPVVQGDPIQLRRLFQNLIANAVKFRRKEEAPRVTIAGRIAADGSLEISVTDNGIGFDEKYLGQLFHPLRRLHSRDEYEGTGIGLAICQKIALRHGGKVTARSELGKGSQFILILPKSSVKAS